MLFKNSLYKIPRYHFSQTYTQSFTAPTGLAQNYTHDAPCQYICCDTHINELQSPSLIINLDSVIQNCRTMELAAAKHKLNLRAHVKTHKTLEIAEMQLRDQSDKRIEVSSIPEAYYFANKGFNDILYGIILSESKFQQIEQISRLQSPQILSVMTDSLYLTQRMLQYAKHHATTNDFKWNIFIKVDSGTKRAGFDITEQRTEQQRQDLLDTVQLIKDNYKYFTLHGIYQYSNECYTVGKDNIRNIFENERQILMQRIDEIKSECNIEIPIISSGSTPACTTVENFEGINEIHPGNYVFFDRMQYEFDVIDDLQYIPISVMTRIIGRYPHRNEILIDCGSVGLSLDKSDKIDVGFGSIKGYPNLKLYALSQEVARITTVDGTNIDFNDEGLQYGDVLQIIPHHSCLMASQHPFYYIVDDNDTVVDVYHRVGGW